MKPDHKKARFSIKSHLFRILGAIKDKKKRYRLLIPVIALILVLSPIAVVGAIQFDPPLAANFADNVLRPVVGNKATISIESVFLSFGDKIKHLLYGRVVKPNANIYTAEPTNSLSKLLPSNGANQALNLKPINLFQSTYVPLSGEGQWNLVDLSEFHNQPIIARTFVRPDAARSYAIVALIQMNMHNLRLHLIAGSQQPGGPIGHPGPGIIPSLDQNSGKLVAAFNGGFQYKDGQYGMRVGSTDYVPLKQSLGNITIKKDGTLSMSPSTDTTSHSDSADAIRQNGPLIIDKGTITEDAKSGGYQVWGNTTTNSIFTWRSGIGLTANGNLLYAVGPSLTADTLAESLKAGGAVEAMQLDINAFWVRYVTFQFNASGGYSFQSILNTLENGGYSYLHGYSKDFFYVTLAQ